MTNEESIFLDSGVLEEYALDMCTSDERIEVERMLASSQLLRQEYEQIQDGMVTLAKSRAIAPPMGTKERILAQLDEEEVKVIPLSKQSSQGTSSSQIWKVAAGAALLVSLGFLFAQLKETRTLQAEIDRLEKVRSAQMAETQALTDSIESIRLEYAFLADPLTEKVVLREQQKYDNLQLVAYWNEEKEKAMLDVSAMPSPPAGKCFQLWADVEGEMVSVAVISADKTLLQTGAFQSRAESLNITLEDAPGSDHATVSALVTSAAV